MKTKQRQRLDIKEITVEGSFEGLLSPYGNVDGGGDVVERGAYNKTLNDQGNTRPVLWQHKTDMPIGTLTLEDRSDGLWCKGQLLMKLPEAQRAYELIKARVIDGLSIGFESVKDAIENGVRHLKEIKLYEGSIVTFPMNWQARITSVKAARETKDDFNEELNEIQLQDAGYQMRTALRCALDSIVWSDLTREEKITATETIIQQFADTYMAYIPLYLDMLAETFGGFEMWGAKRLEHKAGATFSAANKTSLQTHCALVKENCTDLMDSADTILALMNGDAGTAKAVATPPTPAAETKTEPVQNHSAATSLIEDIRSLFSQR